MMLQEEHESLKQVHMKDYTKLGYLKETMDWAGKIGTDFEEEIVGMCENVGGIRQVMEDIQVTVANKLNNEGLHSWLQEPRAHPAGR